MGIELKLLGPNKTALRMNGAEYFFSYETLVCISRKGGNKLITERKFSVTTSKHINQWLTTYGIGRKSDLISLVSQEILEEELNNKMT